MIPHHERSTGRRRVAAFVFLAVACGCSPPEPPTATRDGSPPALPLEAAQRTSGEFAQICRELEASDNEYVGRAQIAEYERRLELTELTPTQRAYGLILLGLEKLRVGESAAAVRLLRQGRGMIRSFEDERIERVVLSQLALAHLRVGEQTNCVAMHGPAACILPIGPRGIHRDPAGSLAAVEAYLEYLSVEPGDATAQWLLNVAAMTAGRWPDAVPAAFRVPQDRLTSSYDIGGFRDVAKQVGLEIIQQSGGAIMEDFDGDGLLDIVTSTLDPCGPMNFYRNDGAGRFESRSDASGLSSQLGGLNVVHADYDNDGDADLLVLRGGWFGADGRMRNSLLQNDGRGRFSDVTRAAGLADPAYPTQTAAWADYDNDGHLDVYIGNETAEGPTPSQLFRNNGDGTFSDVAAGAGVTNRAMAKGVTWGDYDGDGDPDLYVSNLGPNRLYRNDGSGRFTDVADEAGVVAPELRSFPTWFFDYDNDGNLDLFVADYGATQADVAASMLGRPVRDGHPLLYRNMGDGSFRDVSVEVGLTQPAQPMGANFGDLDNDGWLDFYLGVGVPAYDSIAPNLMYRNDRGRRFQDVTYSGGFGHLQKGHGVAFGDLDNDGDQEVFEQMGGAYPGDAYPSVLYENPGHGNRWVTLKLVGRTTNRSAVGAHIEVVVREPGGLRSIHATVGTGGSFGGSSLRQEIGLGGATAIDSVRVDWPTSGTRQVFTQLEPERAYEIVEGEPEPRVLQWPRVRLGG